MAAEFDHLTLSAYMDGELDPQTMQSVERYLDNDAAARRFVRLLGQCPRGTQQSDCHGDD